MGKARLLDALLFPSDICRGLVQATCAIDMAVSTSSTMSLVAAQEACAYMTAITACQAKD